MKVINYPNKEDFTTLFSRPVFEQQNLSSVVKEVFSTIRKNGDAAVSKYTKQFDGADLDRFEVSETEINEAETLINHDLKEAIQLAKENIETFHRTQAVSNKKVTTSEGVICWREQRAIERVGIYIPGGTAPLFSTVLMLGIPATIAGCKEIILCTPPDKNGEVHPAILYAANLVGVTKLFKIGGIQAIGALTFGTETVPDVYKIFGPGNQYVTAAKQQAQHFGVGIDMPAGPSEVLIIADNYANPSFVAADLLSQAEHGSDSQVILLSDSEELISNTLKEVDIQLNQLPRKKMAANALKNSRAVLFPSLGECFEASNFYAPEHLILAIENAADYTTKVINAGSVFLGNYSCESLGDYASGTNHTLPTNGYARSYSGVSVDSFVKKITFQEVNETGLKTIGPAVEKLAEAEELEAHKQAVTIRLNTLK